LTGEDITPLIRRELIREANRQNYTPDEITELLEFVVAVYPSEIYYHPIFPSGALAAYRADKVQYEDDEEESDD